MSLKGFLKTGPGQTHGPDNTKKPRRTRSRKYLASKSRTLIGENRGRAEKRSAFRRQSHHGTMAEYASLFRPTAIIAGWWRCDLGDRPVHAAVAGRQRGDRRGFSGAPRPRVPRAIA